MGVKIVSTGREVPKLKVTNVDLEKILDTTDEWIKSRTGIISRYIAVEETSTSLSINACKKMLNEIDIDPSEIGLVICATMTPNTVIPTVASNVKNALGLADCPAFDINVACSGFVFAVSVAESMMKNLNIKKSIVIGVDLNSQLVDWKDRETSVVFGDGAGAILLSNEKEDSSGIISMCLNTFEDKDNSLILTGPIYQTPFMKLDENTKISKLSMSGKQVMKFAINAIKNSVESLISSTDLTLNDIKLIIPHQANQRIINAAAKSMNISNEKFYMNIEEYANTSAGSIPIALDELNKNKLLKKGDYIILVAFGGGLSAGAILIKW